MYVYCDLTFTNTGSGKGQKCANVNIYVDEFIVQNKTVCETVDVGDTEKTKITYSDPNHSPNAYTYNCIIS